MEGETMASKNRIWICAVCAGMVMLLGSGCGDQANPEDSTPDHTGSYIQSETRNPTEVPVETEVPTPPELEVPVLLYHHIDDTGDGGSCIAEENFLRHLDALVAEGYTTVTMEQLVDYVKNGTPLPEKPVAITFDDGYLSNYEIAYPALAERDMKATIFAIGVSVGKDTYKDTENPIYPHFSYEQAQEMVNSGVISVQTHTYDMHQYPPFEPDGARVGVLAFEDESQDAYLDALRADFQRSIRELEQATGQKVISLAYPFGRYSPESEAVCDELEIPITFTIQPEHARLVKGQLDSLRLLGRYYIDDITEEELLELIEDEPSVAA